MSDQSFVDYYEALELEPGATVDEVKAAYPELTKRYHPDNPSTGDAKRHKMVEMAYSVLTDTARRPSYDEYYKRSKPEGPMEPTTAPLVAPAGNRAAHDSLHFEADRKLRTRLLGLLYDSRRRDGPKGIGDYSLEIQMGINTDDLQFHLWYMTAKGWVARTDDGQISITVSGIDELG